MLVSGQRIMKLIFDFHTHPTFKSFLTAADQDQKDSPWDTFRGKAFQLLAPFLRSQSNFSQMDCGHVGITVLPIVPLEEGFSELALINSVATKFLAISDEFIRWINAENFSYNQLFWEEYEHLCRHLEDNGRRVNVIRHYEEIDESPGVLNLIVSMEGSHGLQNGQRTHLIEQFEDYRANLRKLKQEERFSMLYLTLTHLTWNDVCNHCYGTRISDNDIFKPNPGIKGISHEGYQLIDEAYSVEEGKRVLIDIKHMSALARQELYNYREKKGYQRIPIVASHMGVTGFPLRNLITQIESNTYYAGKNNEYIVVDYKEVPGIGERNRDETDFNPWSINLYDEDIEHIIASDGLIGLSLDQRILGFGRNQEEYFLAQEFHELLSTKVSRPVGQRMAEQDDPDEILADYDDLGQNGESDLRAKRRRHLRYFANNLLHIIRVGGARAWDHVCIGSDFDGLINPINSCTDSVSLPDLEENLIPIVDEMIQEDLAKNPHHRYHITDIDEQVRRVMYENGKRFLSKYFTRNYLERGY